MKRQNSALRIFLYNWPVYVGTWGAAAAVLLAGAAGLVWSGLAWLAIIPLLASIASLGISAYIYDGSALQGGAWLAALLPSPTERWACVHAGLDAEVDLSAAMPGRCVGRLDIFDPASMPAGSIQRARHRAGAGDAPTACSPTALALPDAGCDAIVVAFTAHEIHAAPVRERFFAELHRCLRAGGRLVLVEHVRDAANFLAFGPGFLHFLARREWLRLAERARFSVAHERRVTPWVMVLSLEKRA